MSVSVHTNTSAMIALQNLNATNTQMEMFSKKSRRDWRCVDGQGQCERVLDCPGPAGLISPASTRCATASTAPIRWADVSMAAGESVSDLLNQLREKVVGAMDTSIDTTSRNALNGDFKSILQQITHIVENATFNGSNILDGSLSKDIQYIANADANSTITLSVRTIALGGSIITITAGAPIVDGDLGVQYPVAARRLDPQPQRQSRRPRFAGQADRRPYQLHFQAAGFDQRRYRQPGRRRHGPRKARACRPCRSSSSLAPSRCRSPTRRRSRSCPCSSKRTQPMPRAKSEG